MSEEFQCKNCELYQSGGKHYVLPQGRVPSPLLIVGEAPGRDEADCGQPFVGKAGKVLDQVMTKLGIDRSNTRITNTVLCWPPDNREPTLKEIKACAHHLDAEIDRTDPKIIVPMGNVALKRVLGQGTISKARGKIFKKDGRMVFPTYHPAALFRNPGYKKPFVDDFVRIVKLLEGKKVKDQNKYRVAVSVLDVERVVEVMAEVPIYSIDLETSGFNPREDEIIGVALSHKPHTGIYIPFRAGDYERDLGDMQIIISKLMKLFSLSTPKVFHNGAFDIRFLYNQWKCAPKNYFFDTMLAHHLLEEEKGTHGLKSLARMFPDLADYESELDELKAELKLNKSEEGYGKIPLRPMAKYACGDTDATIRLYYKLSEMLKKNDLENIFYNLTMPLQKELIRTEIIGVGVDVNMLEELRKTYGERVDSLKKQITNVLGNININSSKQLAKALFTDLKLPCVKKTDKGFPSTDKGSLTMIKDRHAVIKLLLQHKKEYKLLNTYLNGKKCFKRVTKNNRIHTQYNVHGTVSGRLSSEGPNLQNIPRESAFRALFVASKGKKFVVADYNQMELRVLADHSKDKKLCSAYNNGEDVHAMTACHLFDKTKETLGSTERDIGKKINFGMVYGMGSDRLVTTLEEESDIHISTIDADMYIRNWFEFYSGVSQYVKIIKETIYKRGWVRNRFGRYRRLPHIQSDARQMSSAAEREGFNFMIQSTASDMTSLSTIRIGRRIRELRMKAQLILTVHDELVYECLAQEAEDLCNIIKEQTEGKGFSQIRLVPIRIDVEVVDRWGKLDKVS